MSWKPEVIADSSGKWCPNGQAFATEKEAKDAADELSMRWFAVRDTRAVESDEPVNYRFENGRAVFIEPVVVEPAPPIVPEGWQSVEA